AQQTVHSPSPLQVASRHEVPHSFQFIFPSSSAQIENGPPETGKRVACRVLRTGHPLQRSPCLARQPPLRSTAGQSLQKRPPLARSRTLHCQQCSDCSQPLRRGNVTRQRFQQPLNAAAQFQRGLASQGLAKQRLSLLDLLRQRCSGPFTHAETTTIEISDKV